MNVENKARSASKWSLITELLSKLAAPIVNMVLARLLTPDDFGMIATITMVTTLADLFTDAGFQKYLVQREFPDDGLMLKQYTNVAFWTNLLISSALWLIIFLFRDQIAVLVGNPGLGFAISIASLSLFLTSFSSIQMARFRRLLDFRTLFFAKLIGLFIPFIVTVPLAFYLRSFWAMIIGNLIIQLVNAIVLTVRSEWKPSFYYNLYQLKDMFGFSIWTLTEQLLGWANLNIGIFFVSLYLSSYEVGLYKTSMATVNQIMSIVVNAISPVLLASLSRVNKDKKTFDKIFYSFEEKVSLVILPVGFLIYVFRDLITSILLGNQWGQATSFIGLWSLMRTLLIVFGIFSTEVFVSLGKPKISVLSQVLGLIVLFPTLLLSARLGYQEVYVARSLVVLWSILVDTTLLYLFARISILKIIQHTYLYFIITGSISIIGYFVTQYSSNYYFQFISVLLLVVLYFGLLFAIPSKRIVLKELVEMIKK